MLSLASIENNYYRGFRQCGEENGAEAVTYMHSRNRVRVLHYCRRQIWMYRYTTLFRV